METVKDESALGARSDNCSEHPAAQTLAEMRARARHLIHAQEDRIRHFETNLNGQLESVLRHYQTQQEGAIQRENELLDQVAKLQQQVQGNEQARATLEETLDEARIALSRASNDQRDLHAQITESRRLVEARDAELEELRNQVTGRSATDTATLQPQSTQLAELRAERDELLERLERTSKETSSSEIDAVDQQEFRDLQQRFEMAVQEVRDLKSLNDQLSQQDSRPELHVSDLPAAGAVGFDWEAQKRRLLEQLESDFDEEDPEQAHAKLTVEGAIRITDQVVADKEREITELKALLQNQSNNLGEVAVGAAAVAEMLDHDELIQQERENLNRLQGEWREKLRKTEVDISVERAKIGRERVALEEKLRSFEAERAKFSADGDDTSKKDSKKPRGNWLTRLGLNEDK